MGLVVRENKAQNKINSLAIKQYKRNFAYLDEWTKTFRDHQEEAFDAIKNNDKGQIILPTGTGKSWIQIATHMSAMIEQSEQGKAGVFVIASHRLALNHQLLAGFQERIHEAGISTDYLFLGTDNSDIVGKLSKRFGRLGVSNKVVDATSTTQRKEVERAYKKAQENGRHLVVVVTYHSLSRLNSIPINIATFDEAHETTKEGFSQSLDEVLPNIDNAYFFTATQRRIGKTGGMANEEKYGKVICFKSPKEMHEKGEIVGPKVIRMNTASGEHVYSSWMVTKTLLEGFDLSDAVLRQVSASPGALGTKLLYCASGLKEIQKILDSEAFWKGVNERNIDVFTFRSTSGANRSGSGQGNYTYNRKKVSRDEVFRLMNELPDKRHAILIHCDILTEGIDLPTITSVMLNRTLALIKLLQTAGRGARLVSTDRDRLRAGEIQPHEKHKLTKPFYSVILPFHLLDERVEEKAHQMEDNIVRLCEEYGVPYEEISMASHYKADGEPVLTRLTEESLDGADRDEKLVHDTSDIEKWKEEFLVRRALDEMNEFHNSYPSYEKFLEAWLQER